MHGVQEKLGQNHGSPKFDATYVNRLETQTENILIDRENANGGNTTRSGKNKVRQSSNRRNSRTGTRNTPNTTKIRKLYRDRAAKLQEFDHQNVMDGGENPTENVRCVKP
jgi:hypothetical protein